jgi:hypothetical protein
MKAVGHMTCFDDLALEAVWRMKNNETFFASEGLFKTEALEARAICLLQRAI